MNDFQYHEKIAHHRYYLRWKNLCSNRYRWLENENLLKNIAPQWHCKCGPVPILIRTISLERLVHLSWNFQFFPSCACCTFCINISQISDIDWAKNFCGFAWLDKTWKILSMKVNPRRPSRVFWIFAGLHGFYRQRGELRLPFLWTVNPQRIHVSEYSKPEEDFVLRNPET
jgi:hypothetical protein